MRLERENLGQNPKCRTAGGDDGNSNDDGEPSLDKKAVSHACSWNGCDKIYITKGNQCTRYRTTSSTAQILLRDFEPATLDAGSHRGY